MIQIAGIAAVCLLLTVLLRKENPTFALLVTVAGAGLLFYTVSKLAGSAFGILGDLKIAAGDTGAYIDLMFKILGISIVTQVVCDVCRDNGASALASQTETAAVLRAKSCVMKTATSVQENAGDILAEAKQINEDRAAEAEAEVVDDFCETEETAEDTAEATEE